MKRANIVPLAAMEKILKNTGADRVSDPAKDAMREIVEEFSEDVAKQAILFSKHAGRKTIKESDVKLAWKFLKK